MADSSGHDMELLESIDPEVRRAAIAALRESANPQAVGALLKVARTDPDQTLRDFARETAYAIGKARLSSDDEAEPDLASISVIRPIAAPPHKTTPHERRFARRRLDQAVNLQIAGKREQASYALAEGLRADPGLAANPTLRGLATAVTDLPTEQAVAYLLLRSKDPAVTLLDDLKPVFAVTPEMIWLFRDIGILFLVLLPVSLVLVNGANLVTTFGHINPLQLAVPLDGPGATVLASVRASLILLVSILLANILSFFVGQVLGGVGLLYAYLKATVHLQIGTVLVAAGLFALNALTILNVPAVNFQSVTQSVLMLSILGGIVAVIFSHGFVIKRAHEFDFIRGVLTAVVSGLLVGVLVAAVSGAFSP